MDLSRAGRTAHGLLVMVVLAACPDKESGESLPDTNSQTNQTNQTSVSTDDSGDAPTGGVSTGGSVGSVGSTTDEPGPTTGATGSEPTTGAPELFGITGEFLLAVGMSLDRDKPLQFIASSVVTMTDGAPQLSICLQPLSLAQGKVTTPREPVGDPLCFEGLAIVDGEFTIDMGVVMVTGMANPITGADIVASMIMAATIESDDFYCGAVTGEVLEPPVGDITGSTFAAVRLADVNVLPDPVIVNCDGYSVTDI